MDRNVLVGASASSCPTRYSRRQFEYLIPIHPMCARYTCDRGPWLQRFLDDSAPLRS